MGTNRRVVVVKSPDPKVFEQAIFILREDYPAGPPADRRKALREAQVVADRYIRGVLPGTPKRHGIARPLLLSAALLLLAAGLSFALRKLGV